MIISAQLFGKESTMMNFTRWMEIFDINRDCRTTAESAMEQMLKTAISCEDWRNILYRCESDTPEEHQALLGMATRAKTFGNWLNVYCEAGQDLVVQKVALEQLIKLANDPVDATWIEKKEKRDALRLPRWQKIFEITPQGSKEQAWAELALHRLMLEKKRKDAERKNEYSPKI